MAAPKTRDHPSAPKELERYLVPTEGIVFMIRRHWLVLFRPVAAVIGGLLLVGFLDMKLEGQTLVLRDIAIWVWVVVLAWLIWALFEWWNELFICTDRRLILLHGLITRKVAMMPMAKVTDMRYDRSFTGRVFGYGVFVLESAGQDQALSVINYVTDPDKHYRQISGILFAPAQRRLSDKLLPASTGSKLPISEPEQAWWRR
jgi:membrane protein YdbS with pleckstrin-like domain